VTLLLVALLAVHLPTHFSPEEFGVRYAQTSPFGRADEPPIGGAEDPTGWRSSPDATLAQCGCGAACVAVPLGIIVALAASGPREESGPDLTFVPVVGLSLLTPAASAAGVATAGRGRGRTGLAYLCAYGGALMLGGLGFAVDWSRPSYSAPWTILGWNAGAMAGPVVGYNLP